MPVAASAIYFLNLRGDVLINRLYRDDVGGNMVDAFRVHIMQTKELGTCPVRQIGGCSFFYMRISNVYIVIVVSSNANVACAFKFVVEAVTLFKSYFGGAFDEDAIRNNFVLIYELLDEIMDFGYPQNLSPEILKLYITQEGVRSPFSSKREVRASNRMNQQQRSALLHSSSLFPPPPGVKLSYGTAGFRADASLLESTVFRVGILAALRSIQTGSVIGLMITASHNKVSNNGVKVADPSGGMLTQLWEPFADAIANAPNPDSLLQLIDDFVKKENITLEGAPASEVLLGRDTRPSGASLVEAAKQGITCIMGATAIDMGVLTTPQLHWMVRAKNKGVGASEYHYYDQIVTSFRYLMDNITQGNSSNDVNDKLIVDGADGVGGEKLEKLKTSLRYLTIDVRNCGDGVLNEGVGADYVQKEKVVPRGFGPADAGIRCASLDGDADRLVYFSVLSNSNKIDLVDGDKILSLFALFLKEQLCILNGRENEKANKSYQASLGVVQTAYANGASTQYLKRLGLEIVLTPTGVKYLHEKAAEYDIGIYFEANGHGTVLFSDTFLSWLENTNNELSSTSKGSDQHKAASNLLAVSKLINQAVGDALSGLLLVEAILQHMGWSIHKWNELYQDLPSRQLKVKVVDRTAVITGNAETIVVSPVGIQEAIDTEIAKYPQGRCFVRPSGTEDVVRVYAEASTQEAADSLADSVVRLVDQYLGFG